MDETGYSQAEAESFQDAMQKRFTEHDRFDAGKMSAEETIINDGLSKMGAYDGQMYRGMSFDDYTAYEEFADLDIGEQISSQSLTSWSDQMGVAERFAGLSADEACDSVIMIYDETNSAVGFQHISKFGAAEGEVLAPSTTSWTVTNTKTMTKYDYWMKKGKLPEFANVDELSEQYVTIISVVEN